MDLIEQILKQARNYLICPICQNHYRENELKFRGYIDNTYIFQAFCGKSHEPLAVTYLASLQRLEKPISAYFHALSGIRITTDAVKKADKVFAHFDGDFKKVWSTD